MVTGRKTEYLRRAKFIRGPRKDNDLTRDSLDYRGLLHLTLPVPTSSLIFTYEITRSHS